MTTGLQSSGQIVIAASTNLSATQAGGNILVASPGVTLTFPSSAETFAISNISSGPITLAYPGGADFGETLDAGQKVLLAGDGGGYWRVVAQSMGVVGTVVTAVDISEVSALYAAPGYGVLLTQTGRTGVFEFVSGDFTAELSADIYNGLYIPSSSIAASSGCWVRQWDNISGCPEWFGAQPNVATADSLAALEACLQFCPVTQLAAADYYISDTWKIQTSNKVVRGIGFINPSSGSGTRILLMAGSAVVNTADVMLVGFDTAQPAVQNVEVSHLNLVREGAPTGTVDRAQGPAGLRVKYVTHGRFNHIASIDHSIGIYIGGVISTKFDDCLAHRYVAGTLPSTDYSTPYYLDGEISFGFAGGNASLYINRCLAIAGYSFLDPIAFYLRGAFADTFMTDVEVAGSAKGIVCDGAGYNDYGQMQDLHILHPVIDVVTEIGIELVNTGIAAAIDLESPYVAAPDGNTPYGILVHEGDGLITITGGQTLNGFTEGGLCIENQKGVTVHGLKILNSTRPVVCTNSAALDIQVQTVNNAIGTLNYAIELNNVLRSYFRPTVEGIFDRLEGGITQTDGELNEVNLSVINPGVFHTVTAAQKLYYNGAPVTTHVYGTDNVRSGVIN